MGLFNKYLDSGDKEEIRMRQQQINEQVLILEGLKGMMNTWFVNKLSKYGLDSNKNWTVNPMTGKITEVKPNPKP